MSKSAIKKILGMLVFYSGFFYLYSSINRLFKKRRLTVLMYHRICDKNKDNVIDSTKSSSILENFERQMKYLSKKCKVISFNDLLKLHREGKKLKNHSVIITFDDGYKDNYEIAYPILKKYNLPATIFLTTGHIENDELFWWDKIDFIVRKTKNKNFELGEIGFFSLKNKNKAISKIQEKLKALNEQKKKDLIKKLEIKLNVNIPKSKNIFLSWKDVKELNKGNISFGAHTVTHPILTKVSFERAKSEIMESKRKIEKETKKMVFVFSYPNGQKNDMSDEIDLFLKKNGFLATVSSIYGTNDLKDGLFRLNRVGIEYDDDLILFKIKLLCMGKIIAKPYLRFIR